MSKRGAAHVQALRERDGIMRATQLAREGRIDARHAPFAEHVCRIPESDFRVLCKLFPGLDSKSRAERDAALERFHASPASEPYRVRRRVMGGRPLGIIIRPPAPREEGA